MLTNQINLDGLFSYIIYSERYIPDGGNEVEYRFKTRTDGNDTCRSVQGCFKDKYIEPNLKLVVDTINKFEKELFWSLFQIFHYHTTLMNISFHSILPIYSCC